MITPRALFQKLHAEDAKKLAVIVNEGWFQRALTYTRAQLSADGISSEQLLGANHFLDAFTALSDEDKPAPVLPDKSQLKSYNR